MKIKKVTDLAYTFKWLWRTYINAWQTITLALSWGINGLHGIDNWSDNTSVINVHYLYTLQTLYRLDEVTWYLSVIIIKNVINKHNQYIEREEKAFMNVSQHKYKRICSAHVSIKMHLTHLRIKLLLFTMGYTCTDPKKPVVVVVTHQFFWIELIDPLFTMKHAQDQVGENG